MEKVYRQPDPKFVDLLNGVRDNTISDEQLELLNRQEQSNRDTNNEGYIFITTHNRKVDSLNASMLRQLPGQDLYFTAIISGKFEEMLYPAEYQLHLKIGAQVMLLKNDKGKARKYFNGKMGILEKIENEKLFVRFDKNELLEIEKEVWRNIDYKYDEDLSALLEHDLGTFQQFPVQLAWAIEEAFLPGQVYVALSRVRSLQGLILHTKIDRVSINVDSRVHDFWVTNRSRKISDDFLLKEEAIFIRRTILKYLDWTLITRSIIPSSVDSVDFLVPYYQLIDSHKKITERFSNEISQMLNKIENPNMQHLDKRINAAVQYFTLEINNN